jgi:site-specific DNA recombinase
LDKRPGVSKQGIPFLANLLEYYRRIEGATIKKILGCIFAEKLVLETRNTALRGDAVPRS